MKILVDGKEVPCQNDVKIIYEDELVDVLPSGVDVYSDLHVTLNCEGLVADVISKGEQESSRSMWKDIEDIIEETH